MRSYKGDPYWTTGRFGYCEECKVGLRSKRVFYYPNGKKAFCEQCGTKHANDFQSHSFDEMVYNSQY